MTYLKVSTCAIAIAAVSCLSAFPAHAQSSTEQPQQATSAEEDQAGLTEITVTAQRRTENLQRVPVSVAAITPERFERLNLQDLKDIQFATPNMTFAKGINYSLVNIRGIGAFNTNPGLEPAVATYIDGAYLERGFGAVYDIVDPGSVQVLRGAQGTLWGRNATGGAVLINTADPEFKFSARMSAEVGSLDHQKAEAVINLPLGDTLAARVAVRYRNEGGYVDDPTTNNKLGWSKQSTIRAKLLFKPSDQFDALFEYQHDRGKGSIDPNTNVLPAVYCAFCGGSSYTYPFTDPYFTVLNNVNGGLGSNDTSDFFNLHLNVNAGPIKLSSVTAYRKTTNFAAGDFDFTELTGGNAFNLYQESGSKTFTQSFQAVSDFGGSFDFSAGVDYLHDNSPYRLFVSNVDAYSGPAANAYSVKTESFSAFGELRVKPAPQLTVTVGGRYTHDKREATAGTATGQVSFDSFTPRVVIAYDAGQANFYASYNRGFKAGGYSGGPVAGNVYGPEKIDSYEFGAKYFSADRTFRANLATFLYKYKDIQVTGVNQGNVGNIASANNAGSATGKGVELDVEYEPSDWIHLFGGLAYLDAKYDSFAGAQVQVPIFNNLGQPTGFGVGTEDLSGFPMPRAPKWTGNFGATLTAPLPSGWKAELTGAAHFTSSFDFTNGAGGPLRVDREPAYTVVQLTGRIYPEGKNYEINFYINNLTNTVYDNYRFSVAPFGAYRLVAPPRSYGVGVTARF